MHEQPRLCPGSLRGSSLSTPPDRLAGFGGTAEDEKRSGTDKGGGKIQYWHLFFYQLKQDYFILYYIIYIIFYLPDDVTSAESLSTLKLTCLPNPFSDYSLNRTSSNLALADLAVVCIT